MKIQMIPENGSQTYNPINPVKRAEFVYTVTRISQGKIFEYAVVVINANPYLDLERSARCLADDMVTDCE